MENPDIYILGETDAEIKIDSMEENRDAAFALAQQAQHSIHIMSQDLDAHVYDNDDFEQCLLNLARRHPDTQVRILVVDSGKAVRNGHRLIRLAQTMTSTVSVKNPATEHENMSAAFLIADGIGLLHRPHSDPHSYDASVNFKSAQRAAMLDEHFMHAWEHARPDPQVRRLHI